MRNRGLVATIVVMSGVIITLIVVLLVVKMPSMLSILDFKDKLFDKATQQIETRVIVQSTEKAKPQDNIEVSITTYTGYDDHVNIEYPVVSGMANKELQEKINFKIRMNALSIIPLYPVSVGIQNLNVYCEVKSIDSKYMTMVYTGTLKGSVPKTQSKTKTATSTKKSTNTSNVSNVVVSGANDNDPYLHGFVDPLAGTSVNLANGNVTQSTQSPVGGNSVVQVGGGNIPSYVTNGNNMPVVVNQNPSYINQNSIIESIANNKYDNVYDEVLGSKDKHTEDKGPTVQEIIAPTAERGYVSSGQSATNSPTGPGMTNTSTSPFNVGGIPVYGHSSSQNDSASGTQKIFYTNTINLDRGTDVTLRDFEVSLAALASYIKSSDVVLENVETNKLTAVKTYLKKMSEATLADELELADFRNRDLKEWPKHFSYRDIDGTIYVSIKLSNKLGDYVLVKYNP